MQEKFSQNDAFSYRLKVAIKASGLKQKEIAKNRSIRNYHLPLLRGYTSTKLSKHSRTCSRTWRALIIAYRQVSPHVDNPALYA